MGRNHEWDRNKDYNSTYSRLIMSLGSETISFYDKQTNESKEHTVGEKDIVKISIFLIALRNGSRIHEAVEAFNRYQGEKQENIEKIKSTNKSKEFETSVAVEKRGYKRIPIRNKETKKVERDSDGKRLYEMNNDGTYKKIYKPYYRLMMIPLEVPHGLPQYKKTDENLWGFSDKYFDFNPHSLRYAFITNAGETLSPQVIAKTTGHATLDMILEYTQQVEADKKLRDFLVDKKKKREVL